MSSAVKQLLYKGIAVHKLCIVHGLKSGNIPAPEPEPQYENGICTVCQIENPNDAIQKVAPPEAWGGMREVNSGKETGFVYN